MVVKTVTVSNAAELQGALASATGGETILLAAGAYGSLQMSAKTKYDITHTAPVTIRSADTDNPAVFTGLDLRGASGFTFENLKFDYTYTPDKTITGKPFKVLDGIDLTFSGCTFDGDVAVNRNAIDNDRGFGIGFSASGCTNLVFENNTVHTFHRGATFGNNDNTVIRGNDFHSIRSDGMNFAAMQGLLIEGNHLHDFKRSLLSGDHADMIQFWTDGTTRPGSDIVIRGNLLDIGAGDHTQSIFMGNEEVRYGRAGPEMFYRNVLIEGNMIYNDHTHGIAVGESAGLVIRNNAVLHADGAGAGVTGSTSVPKISVASVSTGVTIVDNLAGGVAGLDALTRPAGWKVGNNLIVQDSDQSAPNHYSELFVSTTLNSTSPGNGFLALPGGLIETLGIGPDGLRIDETPAGITPLFHISTLPTNDAVFVFDAASTTYGPLGAITPGLGTFLWDFGDGSTAIGGVVSHRYAAPGNYAVTVSVVQPGGSTVSTTGIAAVTSPDLLHLDTRTGRFEALGDTGNTLIALPSTSLAGVAGAWALDLGKPGVTALISKTQIEDLFGADNFALDLTLKADLGLQSFGEVFRINSTLIASVNKLGQFVFQMWGTDGRNVSLTSTGPNLLDGKSHDISLRFDADMGFLNLSVDGATTVSVPATADLRAMGSWSLAFGNPSNQKNFDGKLQAFDLNVDRSDYPVYTGTLPPDSMSALEVTTLDDYVLDGAAMAALVALNPAALVGDAHLVTEGGRTVLAVDGSGDQFEIGYLPAFEPAAQLALSVEFQRDTANGSSGRLLSTYGQVQLMVEGDGFRVDVATADAGMKSFMIGSLGLNDTDWHRATVIIDATADRLQVFMDDGLVLDDQSHDFVMTRPEGGGRGWIAGTYFDGQIAEIRVDDDLTALPLSPAVGSELTAFV